MINGTTDHLTDDEVFELIDKARGQLELYEMHQGVEEKFEEISADLYSWSRPMTVVLNEA
jgi:hypothetical protein